MKTFTKLASVSLVLSGIISMQPAQAVPSFAKDNGMPCTTCHSAFPRLNEFGAKFRLNGYRIPTLKGTSILDGLNSVGFVGSFSLVRASERNIAGMLEEEHHDEAVEDEHHDEEVEDEHGDEAGGDEHGDEAGGDEHGDEAGGDEHGDESADGHDDEMVGGTKSLNFSSRSLLVYSAGTLSENVSYMAHGVVSGGDISLELLNVSFMDILPNGGLNLRTGKMSIDLPYLSSSRRLTYTDYLLQIDGGGGHAHGEAEAAAGGATLTSTGIEANGVYNFSGGQYLEYVFGVGNDQVENSNNNIGANYGYLNYGTAGQNFGLIYRSNSVGETDDEALDTKGFGAVASINFDVYNITSAFFKYSKETDHGETVNINSSTVEVIANLGKNWYLLGRYDRSNTKHSAAQSSQYVASAVYHFSDNVKLQLEYADKDTVNGAGDLKQSKGFYTQITIGF